MNGLGRLFSDAASNCSPRLADLAPPLEALALTEVLVGSNRVCDDRRSARLLFGGDQVRGYGEILFSPATVALAIVCVARAARLATALTLFAAAILVTVSERVASA